jgi:hypothetical protein
VPLPSTVATNARLCPSGRQRNGDPPTVKKNGPPGGATVKRTRGDPPAPGSIRTDPAVAEQRHG